MTMSPRSNRRPRIVTTWSVGSPAGSITQATRGTDSALAKASSESAPRAPSCSSCCTGAGVRLNTTALCPRLSSRRTMLAPIRPSPTMPSCILASPLRESLIPRVGERTQPGRDIRAEMHAQGAPSAFGQHVEIAARLRRLHDGKPVAMAGNGQILGVLAGDLQEHAAVRPALVRLPGGVQEARAEAHARRHMLGAQEARAHVPQRVGMGAVALDISEQRRVVARPQPIEMRLQIPVERVVAPERGGVLGIREQRDPVVAKDRLLLRQLAGFFVFLGQGSRLYLAGLDVRLIE